jgi:serine/threonine-protein kinase HipA
MASARGEAVVHRKADYTLHIFAGHERVAELVQHPLDGSFSLQYEAAWVPSEHGFALAPALPLRGTSTSAGIRRFLENLLPEGQALDDLARAQAISKSNVFGLIRHLGRETTGALTFLPPGQSPGEWLPVARELTFGELQERIMQRDSIPFTLWDGQVRMSVAGQQDKILVHKAGERLFLVDGSLASTHILKPNPCAPTCTTWWPTSTTACNWPGCWGNAPMVAHCAPKWSCCGCRTRCCASAASIGLP